ncbi:MAG: TonB-dependent receptor plug domain-containing protein [Pseudomonadota bacterium]|nr:TonB-dependent receptor plug domain-containing protein [Pseudomonadota bacterium]
MKTPFKQRAFALLSSTCAVAAMVAPAAAQAQTAQDDAVATEETQDERRGSLDSLNTIVVTGTKTQNPEDVQDVPLAVTAFNADTLEAFKVRDIQGLGFQAPNVSLDQIGTSRGQANFSIRGLGINSSIPSIDPTVGVFIDGVYLGTNAGVVFDIFDVESVEILRGPQGVLFGRNVTGGAVVINTGNPTEDLQGKFRAAIDGPVGDNDGGANYTVSGVLSGPLVEDVLLFKVAAYYNEDEGPFINQFDGSNHGAAQTTIVRGALEARLGDLTLTGKAEYFTSEGDGPAAQNRGTFARDSFDFAIDNRGFYENEIVNTSVTAEVDIGPGTLTNIFGYRRYEAVTDADIDSTPLFLFHSSTDTEQDQISNEIRYAVSTDTFDLTVGGFYFDQTNSYTERRDIPVSTPLAFFGGGTQDHEVLGVFASGQYYLTDALSVIAGIRWSQETKDAAVTYLRPRPECSVVDGTCPTSGTNPFIPTENNGFEDRVRFRNVSPKLGLQYEFGDSQVYGHWTRGFRSGGYNFRITNANAFEAIVGTDFAFGEEQVDNFEIGGKFQTADGVFTVNVAGYVTKVQDMQREVNQSDPVSGVAQSIFNTADATIIGFEAETRVRVTDSLILTGNVGIINDEYDEILFDISGDGVINDTDLDLRLPRVPELTFGAGLIHELFIGDNEILTRINYQYRDEFAYTDDNRGFIQSISNLEANITWVTPLDGFSLSVYGRNLFDEVQAGGDTQIPFGGPLSNGVNAPFDRAPAAGTFSPLARGRTIGVEAVIEF